MEIKSTFSALSESEFQTYAETVVRSYSTSAERKQAISFLQQVNSADKVAIQEEMSTAVGRRREQRKKQEVLESLLSEHAFDFSRQPALFVAQTAPTNAELTALLATDNAEVYIRGRTHVGNITISGDNVLLSGETSGGSARSETLINTASVLGDIIIDADNTVIKGINFTSVGEKALTFTTGAKNLTLQDCTFTAGAGIAESKWWWGEHFGGNVTVTNCIVQDFQGVILADFSSTSSATMEQALVRVRVKRNYFKNNLGSIAARGKAGEPMKLCQYSNNKFVTDTMHASFWDFIEGNNSLKVVVTDNEAIAPTGTETEVGKKGFFQSFSKEPKPWTLKYSGNVISNLKVAGKIALNNSFYSPNTSDEDDHLIDLSAQLQNVVYAFSFRYKQNNGQTASADKWQPQGLGDYTPINISTYPAPPVPINPSGYTVVTI